MQAIVEKSASVFNAIAGNDCNIGSFSIIGAGTVPGDGISLSGYTPI